MGFFDNFFGPGKEKQKPKRMDIWTGQQRKLFENLLKQTREGAKGPAPAYPGMMYVPRTPEEETYFNWLDSEAFRKMASGEVPYEVGPEWAERYYQETLKPTYMEDIEPLIREAYAGPGYWSSARADAQRKGAQELGRTHGELLYGEELARRQAIENAMGRILPAMEEARTGGQYSRNIEQEKMLGELQRWFMGEEVGGQYQPMYNPAFNMAYSLLGLSPYTYGQAGSSTGPGFGYQGLQELLKGFIGKFLGGI